MNMNEVEICNKPVDECLECSRETCKLWDIDPELPPNKIFKYDWEIMEVDLFNIEKENVLSILLGMNFEKINENNFADDMFVCIKDKEKYPFFVMDFVKKYKND